MTDELKSFINTLWHDPDEVPEIEREIIWENEHFHGKHLGGEWKPRIDCFGRKERWCYMADITPSDDKVKRPYSRVDYNRGYEDSTKKAIEVAKKWLRENVMKYHWYDPYEDNEGFNGGQLLIDFEEAMEEQL